MAPESRFQHLTLKLRNGGYRLTPQRLLILEILAESEGHPSIEDVYKQVKVQFPMTSLATVYKTVALLKEMGEVLELGFSDGASRYDGNKPHPHPHLICTCCHKIVDMELDLHPALIQEEAESLGYRIVSHRFDVFGLCPDCQKGS